MSMSDNLNNPLHREDLESLCKNAEDMLFDLKLNYKLFQTEQKHRERYREKILDLSTNLLAASKLIDFEANKL